MVKERADVMNEEIASIDRAIRDACSTNLGGIDQDLLCMSIGVLDLPEPLTVNEQQRVQDVMKLLQECNSGCVLVTEERGNLCGIFSERDYLKKLFGQKDEELQRPISEYMTADPLTVTPNSTIAYALNIMSHGGFRHVPVMDESGIPVALLSVRDVTDYLVRRFTDDILNLEIEE